MDVWWHELERYLFVVEELFEYFGCFIVQALKFGSEAFGDKFLVQLFVAAEELLGGAVAERLCQDGVAIVVVEDHDIVVACAGLDGDAAGLVGVNLSGGCWDVDDASVDAVGLGAVVDGGVCGEIVVLAV